MNTLAYAEVAAPDASMASTIASTMQQMSLSFGVAAASLATAIFIPDRFRSPRASCSTASTSRSSSSAR